MAFDVDSGDVAWKTSRNYKCPIECDQTYSTPQVANVDGVDTIVTWGADHLTGHDAKTGKLLWECGGFNPQSEGNWRTIASPSVSDGMAIVPYGRGAFLVGVRLGGSGDITKIGPSLGKGREIAERRCADGCYYGRQGVRAQRRRAH